MLLKDAHELVLKTLKIDPRYQRTPRRRLIEDISKNFRPALFGTITVARRKVGDRHYEYYIVDGQHRVLGAIGAGHEDMAVWCVVHTGLSLAEEAALFRDLNAGDARFPTNAYDSYKAGVCQGDPACCELERITRNAGLVVTNTSRLSNGVCAVKEVTRILGNHGADNLTVTLSTLKAWAPGNPKAFQRSLLHLFSLFFLAYPEAQPRTLVDRLKAQAFDPDDLLSQVRGVLKTKTFKMGHAVETILVPAYNHKLRSNKLDGGRLIGQ
jgi:hypothetical protein